MKFYTQYERPTLEECPLEDIPDEGLVETEGYMSTEKMVNQLIAAGENLQVFRSAEYQADEQIPDDAPALRMMDSLDAELELRSVKKRVSAARAADLEKAKADAAAAIQAQEVKEEKKDGNT